MPDTTPMLRQGTVLKGLPRPKRPQRLMKIGDKKKQDLINKALLQAAKPLIRGMDSQRRIDMLNAVKKAGYLK